MALPQRFLDELLSRADIVDLVGRYVPLKKKGGSFWGCCPFHHEKTPSFHVIPDQQFYKCFGCGEGGNAIHFLMKAENLPYIEAVRKLAEIVGMEVPEEEEDGKNRIRRQRLLALNKDAARYFYDTLRSESGSEARAYLQKRGILPQTIIRFGLGYADQSWDGLILAMREKGYTDQELELARLAGRGKNGGLYCFFRDRVMFPVIDIRGDVVAFGGRILHGDGNGRKYVNSPDTPVYSKSRTLYAMNLAKKSRENLFILCEGNVDVISLHQAGFDSAVASCGTAFTSEQANLLSKYTKEVVICYDADEAGKKATEKAIDLLKASGLAVRVLRLPPRRDAQGKVILDASGNPEKVDPDDYIRMNGAAAFRSLLNRPQTDGQYRLNELKKKYPDLTDSVQKVDFARDVVTFLAGIASPTEQEIYAGIAAKEIQVTANSLLIEAARLRKNRARQQEKRIQREANEPEKRFQPKERTLYYQDPAAAAAEECLLSAVLSDRESLEYAQVRLDAEQFSSPFLGKVYRIAAERLEQGLNAEPAACMNGLSEEECSQLSRILSQPGRKILSRDELSDTIEKIRYYHQKRSGEGNDASLFESILRQKREREKL